MRKARQQIIQLGKWIRAQAANHPIISLLIVVALVGFIWVIWETYNADNLGFDQDLWEWMKLLIIPLVVGLGLGLLNYSQRKSEQGIAKENRKVDEKIALDRQHQTTLETYFDRMSTLILEYDLSEDKATKEARDIARTRTLTVLRRLDAERIGPVFRFIDNTKLTEIISLAKGNLTHVKWEDADLRKANLRGANLRKAKLRKANLRKVILCCATLRNVDLSEANLSGANMSGAKLYGANLQKAELCGADLTGARNYTDEQLLESESLENATIPDGTKYEEWIKRKSEEGHFQSQKAGGQQTADNQAL